MRKAQRAAEERREILVELPGFGFPLCAKRVMQPVTDCMGEREEFSVAIKFDRLLRRIKNNLAVAATLEMNFQHLLQIIVHIAVQVARNLIECVFTIHECLTSFKNLA
jgi:hypothetical protein